MRRGGSFCGGCASACLLIVLIAVVLVYIFWSQVNAALRGIFPNWPFVLAVPILFYAYSWRGPANPREPFSLRSVRKRLRSLLRAYIDLPLGRRTFRLFLFCHGIPDRCFTIRGYTFPLCARCTGLVIGTAAGLLLPAAQFFGPLAAIGLTSILGAPLLVDGLTQAAGLRTSTNLFRVVTGVLGGLGVAIGTLVFRILLLGF